MERDPVCGMTVDPARSVTREEHSGKTFHFCSAGCANKFRAEPERYLNTRAPVGLNHDAALVQWGGVKSAAGMLSADRAAAASVAVRTPIIATEKARALETSRTKPVASGNDYICPMDPEINQDHPGACPKCGMALEPAVPLAPATRIEYTCPMHPEIVRPGARLLPDLRHGARTAHSHSSRRKKILNSFR